MHTNLIIGTTVYSADGQELGTVKEIRGNSFKVDAPMAVDYWLSCDAVSNATETRAQVAFPRDLLNDNKVSAPETAHRR